MRLVTFRHDGSDSVGALSGDRVILLARAYACCLASEFVASPHALAKATLPHDMVMLLEGGDRSLDAARRAVELVERRLSGESDPRGLRGERLTLPLGEVVLQAPIPRPGKLLCIGLNYRDHAEELAMALPERPLLFAKYASSVVGPGAPVLLPATPHDIDFEAELAVVIGRVARDVSEEAALDYVAGYTVMNDVTARDLQFKYGGGQWVHGKSLDSFAPLGPALATRDEIPDPGSLAVTFRLNGQTMQAGNTRDLVFSVQRLIAYFSQDMTLEPGDVIATGTPAGVGHNRKPPVYLKAGDLMLAEVERVGVLENRVVAAGG